VQTNTTSGLPIRWLIIWSIFLIATVAYLDRVILSISGRSIENEFGLDNMRLGAMLSAFVIGYAVAQMPAGWLADKLGARRVLFGGVIWWGIFTSLLTVVRPGPWALGMLILSRFGLGLGEAVMFPASNKIVANWIPQQERGLANGIIFAGVGFGSGITPPLVAYIIFVAGWRSAFWLSAGLGISAGILWFLIARDRPQNHPWVKTRELAFIESGIPVAPISERGAWKQIIRNPDLLCITFSFFAFGYAAYIFFSWFFIYLNDVRKLNLKDSALYAALPFIAMAIGSSLGGWISDWLTKRFGKRAGRCWLAVAGMGLSAILIASGTNVASARLASIFLATGAGALYCAQSSFWSTSADIGGPAAGSVSGFMNMGGQLGGALTASLTPYIAKYAGWNVSFLVAAVLCACGGALWIWVKPERYQPISGAKTVAVPEQIPPAHR
jgi:ACS family glucarate transporter-like MFS transporter